LTGLLELKGAGLGLMKSAFGAENFMPGCLGLSPAISSQFCVKMCAASKNSLKPLFDGFKIVQGHRFNKSKKPVTSAFYDKQHVSIFLQPFLH